MYSLRVTVIRSFVPDTIFIVSFIKECKRQIFHVIKSLTYHTCLINIVSFLPRFSIYYFLMSNSLSTIQIYPYHFPNENQQQKCHFPFTDERFDTKKYL